MFLREQVIRRNGKRYVYHRVVKTYWDKVKKKVRHKTVMNLGKLREDEVSVVKNLLVLKETKEAFITTWNNIKIKKSREYLCCCILHKMFNFLGIGEFIDKVGKRNKVKLSSVAEILIIKRCIKPSSDLKVSSFYKRTVLPLILGIKEDKINPTIIYRTLDELIKIEDKLQVYIYNKIKEKKLDDTSLVFYDITSTYFEGKGNCNLIFYGLSRDNRRDKKQILLALAVTKRGYPFYWEVLPGNVVDKTTVKDLVKRLKGKFGIEECCIVLDRGMVTDKNLKEIEESFLSFVVTLANDEIRKLKEIPWDFLKTIKESNVEEKKQRFKFYNERTYYIELLSKESRRYILCFNPEKFLQERKDRREKIKDIKKYFSKKNKELLFSKKTMDKNKIERDIYYYLKKRKAMKYFKDIEIEEREEKRIKRYLRSCLFIKCVT
jgi:transposase